MRTKLSPRMETKLSPNLVMAGQLLQVSEAGLEQLICRELANNPALELVNDSQPSYFGFAPDGSPNSTSDWSGSQSQDAAEQVAAWPSAIDQLEIQARLTAAGPDLDMAVYLLHSLDERGYLATDIEELAVELGISTEVVEQGLHILHQLGPPGIGARNLRECLLIQCADLEAEGIDCQIVRGILTNAWDDFIHQRWGRVARHLSLPEGAVVAAWQFVARNLYPHPLTLVATTSAGQEAFLRPDLIIHCELQDGQPFYQLEIPAATVWELRVSECFAVALRTEADDESSLSNGEKAWIRSHLECARLFINALGQRWATLRRIGEYLIDYQVEFLEHGPRHLKPLTHAAVARDIGLHESTVSRAISEKTVLLPSGQIIPLSNFFDTSLPPKDVISKLLARSSRPLSDREIVDYLQAEGINLARRTVAKYRQQLAIPPSYHRKRESALTLVHGGQP